MSVRIANQRENNGNRNNGSNSRNDRFSKKPREFNDTNKIVVSNLDRSTTTEGLGEAFKKFGNLESYQVCLGFCDL